MFGKARIPGMPGGGGGAFTGTLASGGFVGDYLYLDIANQDARVKRDAAGRFSFTKDGVGAGTAAGWKLGYGLSAAVSMLWSSVLAPSATNFVLKTDSTSTTIGGGGGSANGIIYFSPTGTGSRANFDGTAGAGLAITAGTATTGVSGLSVTQTWNNAAQAFTLIYANATDTTSSASSLLMDLQAGGVSQFKVSKAGTVTVAGNMVSGAGVGHTTGLATTGTQFNVYGQYVSVGSAGLYGFTAANQDGALDSAFSRISAGVVGVGTGAAGSTAGELRCTNIRFGTHTGLAAETVTGYITITDSGGTSRKIAVVS